MDLVGKLGFTLFHDYSPKMTAIVGGIIGHDFGVRDRKGGKLGPLSITSDGFVIAQSTASDGGGAFVGTARDLERNIELLLRDAKLSNDEQHQFDLLFRKNVTDWRTIAKGTCKGGTCPPDVNTLP
jgi:hypothetical protein